MLTCNREALRAAAESPCGHGVIHDALTFASLSPESEDLGGMPAKSSAKIGKHLLWE